MLDATRKAMDEVTIIYQKLDEKHPGAYYSEQLKVWAHLISNGSHTSYDAASNNRFFHGRKNPGTSHVKDSNEFSPAKRCNLRSQYIVAMHEMRLFGSIIVCMLVSSLGGHSQLYVLHHGENNHIHLSKQICTRKRSIILHISAMQCAGFSS